MKNVILSLAFLLMIPAANAGIISFEKESTIYNLNDTFEINIIGTGFERSLDGFRLNIDYDESVLELKTVNVDSAIWDFAKEEGDRSEGKVKNIAGASFVADDFDRILFATLSFVAKAGGSSDLMLSDGDNRTFEWSDSSFADIPLEFQDAQVQVGPVQVVPVPAAIWFMFTALGSMMAFGRSKNRI